jgi:hypothetical protein
VRSAIPSLGQDIPAIRDVNRWKSRSLGANRELTTAFEDSLKLRSIEPAPPAIKVNKRSLFYDLILKEVSKIPLKLESRCPAPAAADDTLPEVSLNGDGVSPPPTPPPMELCAEGDGLSSLIGKL